MMTDSEIVVISPYSKPMRNGQTNPKNYPYWGRLVEILASYAEVIQIGTQGEEKIAGTESFLRNLSFEELRDLINCCDTWISVDNFLPHFCHCEKLKPGIVLWGKSDPKIFGYPENVNLLKSRTYLRSKQFDIWEVDTSDPNAFVLPEIVAETIMAQVI